LAAKHRLVNISLIPVDAPVLAIRLQGNPMPPKPAATSAINSAILVRLVCGGGSLDIALDLCRRA